MIISASRRTDIPAFYSEWLFHRIECGEVLVRNPVNKKQIGRISLRPEDVDCLILWTKNPGPLIPRIEKLSSYRLLFQYTITPYGKDIEPGLPEKKRILKDFIHLSGLLGKEHLIWRYDPILFSSRYDMDFHLRAFRRGAERLAGYTERCVISFLTEYDTIKKALTTAEIEVPGKTERIDLAGQLTSIAAEFGMRLSICCPPEEYPGSGLIDAGCIDSGTMERITGKNRQETKDKGQRKNCRCLPSRDIGTYGTCSHGCLYCYAGRGRLPGTAIRPTGWKTTDPMLFDSPEEGDRISPPPYTPPHQGLLF